LEGVFRRADRTGDIRRFGQYKTAGETAKEFYMKKISLLVLVLAAFAAGEAFAQNKISAGVGGFIGGDFGGGAEGKLSQGSFEEKLTSETPYFGGGGFIFLDATYAELSLSFLKGGVTDKVTVDDGSTSTSIEEDGGSFMNFNIGLLGKYPIAVGEKLKVFPLLGIEYDICLSAKEKNGIEYKNERGEDASGDFSALWFKLGGGLDINVTETVYFRFEALYGFRLANKAEKDLKDFIKELFERSGIPAGVNANYETLLGHGITVKLAVGFNF
jgi:opacity protein-like surface antigen